MIMVKKELVREFANRNGVSLTKAQCLVDSVFGIISEQLIAGNDVKITGFGRFYLSNIKARTSVGVNGETILIPATTAPRFRAGIPLKCSVRASMNKNDNNET